MDIRQSREYANYMKQIGWSIEEIKQDDQFNSIFIRQLPLVGSVIKIQRPQSVLNFDQIDKIANNYKAIFVKLEAFNQATFSLAKTHGFKEDNWTLLPTKTLQLDITPSLRKIIDQMKKDTRYELRKINNSLLQLIKVEDLNFFRKCWKNSAKRGRWVPPTSYLESLKKAFGENILLLAATNKNGDRLLAGTTILIFNNTAYYYFAFCSPEGKKLSLPYFLVWEAIKLAKQKGCKIFDFEGIEDSRFKETKSWKGFTHFKRSFGGQEIEYPPPLIKYYNPILKLISHFV